jgi:phosphoglycolate phosphatase
VLAKLGQSGFRMYVATSKPRVFARRIIDHFALARYFQHVFGSELDGTRVHKADLIAYALEQTGADPSHSLMIGDRSHDVLGAKANGVDAIGVTYGYGNSEELIAAGARQLCVSPRAVLDVILSARANAVSTVNPS